jgi:rRNA maturation endonuclease Nob1
VNRLYRESFVEALGDWEKRDRLTTADLAVVAAALTEVEEASGELRFYVIPSQIEVVVRDMDADVNVAWVSVGYVRAMIRFDGSHPFTDGSGRGQYEAHLSHHVDQPGGVRREEAPSWLCPSCFVLVPEAVEECEMCGGSRP